MSEIKFTREELGHLIAYAGRGGYASQPQGRLAAFALTQMDRIEQLERELREAEEAMLNLRSAVLKTRAGEPREALWELLKRVERWSSREPSVARALARMEGK